MAFVPFRQEEKNHENPEAGWNDAKQSLEATPHSSIYFGQETAPGIQGWCYPSTTVQSSLPLDLPSVPFVEVEMGNNGLRSIFLSPSDIMIYDEDSKKLVEKLPSITLKREESIEEQRKPFVDVQTWERWLKGYMTAESLPLPDDKIASSDDIRKERRKTKKEIDPNTIEDPDQRRIERRKAKNRVTAERSRQRKIARVQRLEIENSNLKKENQKLVHLSLSLLCQMGNNLPQNYFQGKQISYVDRSYIEPPHPNNNVNGF